MKVTIDLDQLLQEGQINREEYDKLSKFAARSTSGLAFNVLIGFGVTAVSGAALALLPGVLTAIAMGLFVCGAGVGLAIALKDRWRVLANICILVGALLFSGGVVTQGSGSLMSFLVVAAVFMVSGIFARSSLLVVLSVFALSSCLGTRTDYLHASYFLGVKEPLFTVIVFLVFGIFSFKVSKRVPPSFESIALSASRTCVFLINFGFWVGSLWGDVVGDYMVSERLFSIAWAVALICSGVWAWQKNRRWLVNVVAVFGAIHLYTQWFESLGGSPSTVLIAGVTALGFAIGLRAMNLRIRSEV